MDEDEEAVKKVKSEVPVKRREPKKVIIPRRAPSIVIPERQIVYVSPDKLTCAECPCYPKEDPYVSPKKFIPCLQSPLTLYELAVAVLDSIPLPEAFTWSVQDVMKWMDTDVGFPQYVNCIFNNHIDGRRLIMLEDPSKLPFLNIRNVEHIQIICGKVRKLYSTDFIRFCRSIGLPPRKPLTHCTWFKSKTGPSWGIRKNWTRGDILRWMKIIMPAPIHRDHWDLVWYLKPDFPKVMFARVPNDHEPEYIPHYIEIHEVSNEYMVQRKFLIQTGIRPSQQLIWMERVPEPVPEKREEKRKVVKESRLSPKKISLKGLTGVKYVLAKRKMPKAKFDPAYLCCINL